MPETDENPGYASIPGMDPYVDWALGAGKDHFFLPGRKNTTRMPVLIQLRGISAEQFASGNLFIEVERRNEWQDAVQVPALYTKPMQAAKLHSHCTALVTQTFFNFMRDNKKLQQFVPRVALGLPLDLPSLPKLKPKASRRKGRS